MRRSSRTVQAPSITASSTSTLDGPSNADADKERPSSREHELSGMRIATHCGQPVQEAIGSFAPSNLSGDLYVDESPLQRHSNSFSPLASGSPGVAPTPCLPGSSAPWGSEPSKPICETTPIHSFHVPVPCSAVPGAVREQQEFAGDSATHAFEFGASSGGQGLYPDQPHAMDVSVSEVKTCIGVFLSPSPFQMKTNTPISAEDGRISSSASRSTIGDFPPAKDEGIPLAPLLDDVEIPEPSVSSGAGPSSNAENHRPPKAPSHPNLGVDVRSLRSLNPPTSYLAPNPVRQPPRSPKLRRDPFRYLPLATKRAALLAFAQTRLVLVHSSTLSFHGSTPIVQPD